MRHAPGGGAGFCSILIKQKAMHTSLQRYFDFMDSDRNGKLTIAELRAQNGDADVRQLLCMLLKHDAEHPADKDIITDDQCIDLDELRRLNDSAVFPDTSIFKLVTDANGRNRYLLDPDGNPQVEEEYAPYYAQAASFFETE